LTCRKLEDVPRSEPLRERSFRTRQNSFVCRTKRQAQEAVSEEAKKCGAFFVNHRWLAGTLTMGDPAEVHQAAEIVESNDGRRPHGTNFRKKNARGWTAK